MIRELHELVQRVTGAKLRIYAKEIEVELLGKVWTIPRTEKGKEPYKEAVEALKAKLKA